MLKAKESWVSDQCEEIEQNLKLNNSKKAYDTVKSLTKPIQAKVNSVRDKNGEIIIEKSKILDRWTQYCSELYNFKLNGDAKVLETSENINDYKDNEILRSEVEDATKSLKKGKSPGIDNIPGELIQAGGEHMTSALLNICNLIWKKGKWPDN